MNTPYQPPYTITSTILNLVAEISELIGRLSMQEANASVLRLRRINRIRTIQGSLAIEGNIPRRGEKFFAPTGTHPDITATRASALWLANR